MALRRVTEDVVKAQLYSGPVLGDTGITTPCGGLGGLPGGGTEERGTQGGGRGVGQRAACCQPSQGGAGREIWIPG